MAFVDTLTWSVNFSFEDNNKKISGTSVRYPVNLSYAQVVAAATALGQDLQDASDASLFAITITKALINDTPVIPGASSEVERKLRIPLGTARRENASSLELPSPVFALEQENTDVVSTSNPLMVPIVTQLTAGLAGPGNGIVTIEAQDITRIGIPVIVHRSRPPRR